MIFYKQSKRLLCWYLFIFAFYCANFGQQNGVTWKDIIEISIFLNEKVWHVLFHFGVVFCTNFLKIGQQNGVTWKGMIDISTFRVWDTVIGTCLNSTFSNKLLIDIWGVVLNLSITSLITVSNVFWDPWSQLTSQNVLRSFVSPWCFFLFSLSKLFCDWPTVRTWPLKWTGVVTA